MKKGEEVKPKIELFHSTVLISADVISQTITTPNQESGTFLKEVQTVLAVGPHISLGNGMNLNPGDRVLLNTNGLDRKGAAIGEYICFDKKTGEFDGFVKKDTNEHYFIVDSRRILCKI